MDGCRHNPAGSGGRRVPGQLGLGAASFPPPQGMTARVLWSKRWFLFLHPHPSGEPWAFRCLWLLWTKKKEEKCLQGAHVLNGAGGGGREPRQQTCLGLLSSQLGNKFTDTGNNFFPDSANSLMTLTRRAPQGGELELCKKLSAEALFKATWGMLKY